MPETITEIGAEAFAGQQLTSINIPNSVTRIGKNAFAKDAYSNPDLTTIYNKTGLEFDWGLIINGTSGDSFITGDVANSLGNVEIKAGI